MKTGTGKRSPGHDLIRRQSQIPSPPCSQVGCSNESSNAFLLAVNHFFVYSSRSLRVRVSTKTLVWSHGVGQTTPHTVKFVRANSGNSGESLCYDGRSPVFSHYTLVRRKRLYHKCHISDHRVRTYDLFLQIAAADRAYLTTSTSGVEFT